MLERYDAAISGLDETAAGLGQFALGPDEPFLPDLPLVAAVDAYLTASAALGGALFARLPDDAETVAIRSAPRRLAAAFAGDLVVAGLLASLATPIAAVALGDARADDGDGDGDGGADDGDGTDAAEDAALLRGFVQAVRAGTGGDLPAPTAGAAIDPDPVLGAVDAVLTSGEESLQKVLDKCFRGALLGAVLDGVSSVTDIVAGKLPGDLRGWVVAKIRQLVELARDKLLGLIGRDQVAGPGGWIATVLDQAQRAGEGDRPDTLVRLVYQGLFRAADLRQACFDWLQVLVDREADGSVDVPELTGRLAAVELLPQSAAAWLAWANYASVGVRVARYVVHGALRSALYVAGGLLVIYVLFVTEDHLDWPLTHLPGFVPGVSHLLGD